MLIQLRSAHNGGLPDLDEFFKKLTPSFKKKIRDPFAPKKSNWRWWVLVICILLGVVLGFSSMVTVKAGQSLVVTRFGAYHATEGQGLHWTLPLVDQRTLIDLNQTQTVSYYGAALTQDGNLVNVAVNLSYQVQDGKAYLFAGDAAQALQAALSQATTAVMLESNFADLLSNNNWKQVGANISQNLGDLSGFGVKLTGVEVQNIQVPDALAGAFNTSLSKAQAQSQQLISDANSFAANLQPLAAEKAASSLAYADAAKFATEVTATRDAAEFASLVPAYRTDSAAALAYLPLLLANNWRNIQAISQQNSAGGSPSSNGSQAASYARWQAAIQQNQAEAAQNEEN